MKRRQRGWALVLLAVWLVAGLAACAGDQATVTPTIPLPPERPATPTSVPGEANFPVAVEDPMGNMVRLTAEPERIISLSPAYTEILYALGLGERVVGVTVYCDYPPEVQAKPDVGGYATIDLAKVRELRPDLVLAIPDHMAEAVPALEAEDIPVYVAQPATVIDALKMILTVGHLTGREGAARALAIDMHDRIQALQAQMAGQLRPRVFWEADPALISPGPGTLLYDVIETAGGDTITAGATTPWVQFDLAGVASLNPEVIVLADGDEGMTPARVSARPEWAGVSAVESGRIVAIPDEAIFTRPGPRLIEGIEFLVEAFYLQLEP
jgi:iron complex transport system substrate-binding protein